MGVEGLVFEDDNAPQCDAQFLNSVRAEINNLISNTGLTPSTSNLNQLGVASSIMAAGSDYYSDTGTANNYVLSPVGGKSAPSAYFTGMRVRFIVAHTNTSGTVNIIVNGIASTTVKALGGTNNIAPGDFLAGQLVELWFNGSLFVVSGGVPFAAGSVPPGSMFDFAGNSAPAGYLLCFGQAVSRSTFSVLFGVIGTTYGTGDGTSTFNLPDRRGRGSVGLDNMGGTLAGRNTNATTLNNTGGGSQFTAASGSVSGSSTTGPTSLSAAQMAPITISMTVGDVNNTVNTFGASGDNGRTDTVTSFTTNAGGASHTHVGGSLTASFAGSPVDTTAAWIAANVIIKT